MADTPPQSVDELLGRMVRFDTVNPLISGRPDAEAALAEWLERAAQQWGLPTRRLPLRLTDEKAAEIAEFGRAPTTAQLLIDVPATRDDAPALLFDSHLDTVAVEGMTIDPFGAQVRDGKLFGRGACDTKGTGAAMLWALKQYAECDERPNRVALLFSVDEEMGMTGIASFIANDRAALGFEPAGVIVGEPTMLKPVIAHNGLVRWKVTTKGVAAHSSAPYLGRSAIRDMVKVIAAIEDRYIAKLSAEHDLTGSAVCNITVIRGGSQVNILPEHCEIDIDRRLVPGESADDETVALQRVLDEVKRDNDDVDVTLATTRQAPPLDAAANERFLPAVQRVLESMSLPALAIGAPFCTHAGDLAAAGLPALVWGPGNPYPAHTKDEYVELDAVRQGADAYLALMRANLQRI